MEMKESVGRQNSYTNGTNSMNQMVGLVLHTTCITPHRQPVSPFPSHMFPWMQHGLRHGVPFNPCSSFQTNLFFPLQHGGCSFWKWKNKYIEYFQRTFGTSDFACIGPSHISSWTESSIAEEHFYHGAPEPASHGHDVHAQTLKLSRSRKALQ